tara:strand:+ start:3446 stop:3664 length:219 start_codon:yes stop_codon:yes gene_type:complete
MPFSTPEQRKFEASQITVKEFENKLTDFITSKLGMDIIKGGDLMLYNGFDGETIRWTINIHRDDLADSSDLY